MKKAFVLAAISILFFSTSWSQAGSLDPGFNGGKVFTTFSFDYGLGPEIFGQDEVSAIAVQADGKIVAIGKTYNGFYFDFAIARYNTNGTLDNTFGDGGMAHTSFGTYTGIDDRALAVAIQADGKIIVVGLSDNGLSPSTDFTIVRYKTNGSPDSSFGINGIVYTGFGGDMAEATCVSIQADGKIVVAGYTAGVNPTDFAVARYNIDGSPDNSFNGNGKVVTALSTQQDEIYSMVIQPDGKILVAGRTYAAFKNEVAIVRYNMDGSPDNSFDGDGVLITSITAISSEARGIALQSDGKIVIAGPAHSGTNIDFFVARFNSNGTSDNSFDGDGKTLTAIGSGDDHAFALTIQNDGKIIVAGNRINNNAPYDDFAMVRYNTNGTPDNTFDGDGKLTVDMGNPGSERAYSITTYNDRIYVAGPCLSFSLGYYIFAIAALQMGTNTILPLTLGDFSATVVNNTVELRWITFSEHNTSHFIIERSNTGSNFTAIGTVTAAGYSGSERRYSLADLHPFPGINFYRLKMMDIDGRYTHSKTIAVVMNAITKKILMFPNPANDVLHVQINSIHETALMQITDIAGRTLKQQQLQLAGTHSFSVDVNTFPKGKYYLILQLKGRKEVHGFIKN